MDEQIEFAPRLRALRKRAGLTQTQLAEKAQMHRQGIVKLERGEREPAWSTLLSLAKALSVGLQEFVDVEPDEPEGTPRGRPRKAPAVSPDNAQSETGQSASEQGTAEAGGKRERKKGKRKGG